MQTECRRQRRLAVPFRDPKQADRVDAAALLVAAPELAQEVTLEALEGEGDAGTLTRLVAEEMGEEALELAEAARPSERGQGAVERGCFVSGDPARELGMRAFQLRLELP